MSNFLRVLTFLACVTLAGPVFAQTATATIVPVNGVAGQTVVVPVNYTAGSDIGGVEIDVDFPAAAFSAVSLDCTVQTVGAAFNFCDDSNPGTAAIKLARIDGAVLTDGLLAEISFTIDASAEGAQALDGVFVAASDTLGNDLTADSIVITDGAVNVLGPAFESFPAPGPIDLGSVIQNASPDPSTSVIVGNVGADNTTLTVTCSEMNDTGDVFTISPNTEFTVDKGGPTQPVQVICDSAGAIQTHTAQMSCVHDGGDPGSASPALYDLSCTITAGPQPAYDSTPTAGTPINMSAPFQGDPIADELVAISNSGDAGTTLTGTCSLLGPDAQISLAGGAFSVDQGGAPSVQTLSCDSSAEGVYTNTLSCTHNGSNASPADYEVSCDVGPQRPAIFASDPAPDSVVDMTPGEDPPVGDPNPTSVLTFFNNAQEGASDLYLVCNQTSGQPNITVAPDLGGGAFIDAGDSLAVTFTCDTSESGSFSAAYECSYETDGQVPVGTLTSYTYNCDVRDAMSEVSTSPAGGSTITQSTTPGGSELFEVVFSEVADESVAAQLTACSLADGSNFSILDPASFPVDIVAGAPVTVTVEGTDPGTGENGADTLTCTYEDTANPEGIDVSFDLVLEVGGNGRFIVSKEFTDGNTGEVMVTLSCDTGLPLEQSFMISGDTNVAFVVTSFESGAMNCSVTEESVANYMATYTASGDSENDDSIPDNPGCHFFAIDGGDVNSCAITNAPGPVEVEITKEWVFDGAGGDDISQTYSLTLTCDSEIVGEDEVNGSWTKIFSGEGNGVFTAMVVPDFPSSHCSVEENSLDSYVASENGCQDIVVSAGQGDACLITNTVFFESIPTLSQWGMAIMALLMLGVGMIGFRRFT
jgi:hypothetical protein